MCAVEVNYHKIAVKINIISIIIFLQIFTRVICSSCIIIHNIMDQVLEGEGNHWAERTETVTFITFQKPASQTCTRYSKTVTSYQPHPNIKASADEDLRGVSHWDYTVQYCCNCLS